MNSNTRQEFEVLGNELSSLYARWITFLELYGTSQEDLDLLHEMSPSFFRVIQDTFADALFLGLCKLTDPSTSRVGKETRENLSFYNLLEKLHDSLTQEQTAKLSDILARLETKTDAMRVHRNRRITHPDKSTKLNVLNEVLPAVTREVIEGALSLSATFLNTVAEISGDNPTGYEFVVVPDSGKTILHYLRMAKAYDRHWGDLRVDPYSDGVIKKQNAS